MFIDLLRKRRSIRSFQDTPIEEEKVKLLLEAVLRAPSSRSLNPWEFVVVTRPDILKSLSVAKPHGAAFVKNAQLAIAVCADPARCDVWVEDCSIAAIILQLQATDLGLGSCWAQIRKREFDDKKSAGERASEILSLKEGMEVLSIIAIGYAAKEVAGHPKESLPVDHLSYEKFGMGKEE
jgi:nitroreductase